MPIKGQSLRSDIFLPVFTWMHLQTKQLSCVLHEWLHFKPNSLQLVQALTGNDQERRLQMETDGFLESIVFSDEATFHLSGKVNRYMRIWGAANPYVIVEYVCYIPLLNCFVCRCILVKTGQKISLGRLWPLMGIGA